MRTSKIIDFEGMRFTRERLVADRLRRRARLHKRSHNNYVAKNVRSIFEGIFGL